MIFNKNLAKKALEIIHQSRRLCHVLNDIKNIEKAIDAISDTGCRLHLDINHREALMLDGQLRRKYPAIKELCGEVNTASQMTVRYNRSTGEYVGITRLKEAYYGILCDVLLKRRIINSVTEFIDYGHRQFIKSKLCKEYPDFKIPKQTHNK